jgi:hypothetical protein
METLTLDRLARAHEPAPRAELADDAEALALGALAKLVTARAESRRNAAPPPFQTKLKAFYDALVNVYGVRPEPPPPGRGLLVPYIPVPTAGAMLAWIRDEARRVLAPPLTVTDALHPIGLAKGAYRWWTDTPDDAKQPGFINKWLGEVERIVGKVDGKGNVTEPNRQSIEPMPADVAARAFQRFGINPTMKGPMGTAGKIEAPPVLSGAVTFAFFDALQRLAIHFDNLRGSQSRISIGAESVKESIDELPDTILNVVTAPMKAASRATADVLKWVGLGLLGLGALWVVSR